MPHTPGHPDEKMHAERFADCNQKPLRAFDDRLTSTAKRLIEPAAICYSDQKPDRYPAELNARSSGDPSACIAVQ